MMQRFADQRAYEIADDVARPHELAVHEHAVHVIAQMQRCHTHAVGFKSFCIGTPFSA